MVPGGMMYVVSGRVVGWSALGRPWCPWSVQSSPARDRGRGERTQTPTQDWLWVWVRFRMLLPAENCSSCTCVNKVLRPLGLRPGLAARRHGGRQAARRHTARGTAARRHGGTAQVECVGVGRSVVGCQQGSRILALQLSLSLEPGRVGRCWLWEEDREGGRGGTAYVIWRWRDGMGE